MPLLARRAASATERTLVYFRMTMYMRPPMRLSSSPTHQSISGPCWTRAYFRDGSIASVWLKASHFRGRDASYLAPPAQIRTGPIRAYGSHLGCLTAKRLSGHG